MTIISKSIQHLVKEVLFVKQEVVKMPDEFKLIGQGRSAAVFKWEGSPSCAVKIFYPDYHHLAIQEGDIYKRLSNHHYFPELVEVGDGFLVLELLDGITIYDCLVTGVPITPEMVKEVDNALDYAKERGLNPSDIHLKNIILTKEGKIKVIDVVRFNQDKECPHWSDLKKAYYTYYQKKYFPKKMTPLLVEVIIRLYRKRLLPI
ncbi:serine/threonine protein kinase [Halobacillus sp. Marseille-Q1614]|uniref:serine/threonine protein kinase n=1 Tax=Halobacillus sp. Marseille-Q1614 TaxID=2709134 RepID=UPI00156EDD38|nr:serine/threonine protein kinase [Halobacillus sp. Marseille-Q1614]